MRRVMRWTGIAMAALVGVLVVAVASVLIWVETPHGHETVRHIALKQARAIIPGLEVGQISGNYFSGLELRDAVLKDGTETIATLPRVTVHYALWPLIHLSLRISRVEIERPDVHLRIRSDGELNLLHALVLPPPTPPQTPPAPPTKFQITVDEVVLSGGEFQFDDLAAHGIELAGSFHWDTNKLAAAVKSLALKGDLGTLHPQIALSGGGSWMGTEIDARVTAAVAGVLGEPVKLDASAVGSLTRFPLELSLATEHAGSAKISGELGVEPFNYHVYTAVDKLSLGALLPALSPSRVSLHAAIEGEGIPVAGDGQATVTVSVAPSTIAGVPLAAALVQASAKGANWRVEQLEASTSGAWIYAHATGKDAHVNAEARVVMTGATRLPAPVDSLRANGMVRVHATGVIPTALSVQVDGLLHQVAFATVSASSVAVVGDVQGVPAHPVGTVAVHVRGFAEKSQGPLLAALDAHVTASRDALDARVTANADASRLKGALVNAVAISAHVPLAPGDGVPKLAESGDIEASVLWKDFPLTLANSFAGTQIFDTGTGDVDVKVSGSVRQPVIDAHVAVSKAALYGVNNVGAQLALKTDAKQSTVTLSGQLKDKQVLDVSAQMQAGLRSLSHPETLVDVPIVVKAHVPETGLATFEGMVPELLRGKVAVNLDINGTAGAPNGQVDFAWTHASISEYHLGVVSAGVLIASAPAKTNKTAATRVTLGAEVFGHRLLDAVATAPGSARVWLQEKNPPAIEVTAHIPDFDLATLAGSDFSFAHSTGKLRADFSGTVAGANVKGDGTLKLVDAKLADQPVGSLSATLHYAPGNDASAHLEIKQPKGGSVDAKVALRESGLDAALQAQKFDLAFIGNVMRQIRAIAGTVDANVTAKGKLDALALAGTVGIKNATFGMSQMPTLKGIDIDVAVKPEHADVTINQVKSGSGTLKGTVAVNLDHIMPTYVDAKLKTKDFQLGVDGVADATLDSSITAHITLAKAVTGDVEMTDAVLHVPKIDPGSSPRSAARPPDIIYVDRQKELAKLNGEAVGTPIDINVKVSPLFVRGKQIDAELGSDLQIKVGADGKFAPRGSVTIRSGFITLFDRRYDIVDGRVGLDGDTDINPTLKFRMQHQFSEAMVTLGLQGSARAPELILLSDPAVFDRAQIISLVINGQVSSSDSRSPDAKNTLTNAVLGAALGSLADSIAPKIGLDVLKVGIGGPQSDMSNPAAIAAANQSDPNATQARVEVGKYIAHRLYVSYDRVFGAQEGQNSNEAKLEYRMTPRLTLQSLFGDAGVGGLDLQWTYRY